MMKPFSSLPFALASIIICLAITQHPLARAHTQVEEACKIYNIIATNGTQCCASILNSLPGNKTNDNLKTIAQAGMELAERMVAETSETIRKKLHDKSLKPRYFGPLRTCVRLYNDGSYSFGYGLLGFQEQNYDTVNNYQWLNGAYNDANQCERELRKVGAKGQDFGIDVDYLFQVLNAAQAAFLYFANKSYLIYK